MPKKETQTKKLPHEYESVREQLKRIGSSYSALTMSVAIAAKKELLKEEGKQALNCYVLDQSSEFERFLRFLERQNASGLLQPNTRLQYVFNNRGYWTSADIRVNDKRELQFFLLDSRESGKTIAYSIRLIKTFISNPRITYCEDHHLFYYPSRYNSALSAADAVPQMAKIVDLHQKLAEVSTKAPTPFTWLWKSPEEKNVFSVAVNALPKELGPLLRTAEFIPYENASLLTKYAKTNQTSISEYQTGSPSMHLKRTYFSERKERVLKKRALRFLDNAEPETLERLAQQPADFSSEIKLGKDEPAPSAKPSDELDLSKKELESKDSYYSPLAMAMVIAAQREKKGKHPINCFVFSGPSEFLVFIHSLESARKSELLIANTRAQLVVRNLGYWISADILVQNDGLEFFFLDSLDSRGIRSAATAQLIHLIKAFTQDAKITCCIGRHNLYHKTNSAVAAADAVFRMARMSNLHWELNKISKPGVSCPVHKIPINLVAFSAFPPELGPLLRTAESISTPYKFILDKFANSKNMTIGEYIKGSSKIVVERSSGQPKIKSTVVEKKGKPLKEKHWNFSIKLNLRLWNVSVRNVQSSHQQATLMYPLHLLDQRQNCK